MDWYLMALKKYADFKGRSQRKEYWMFTLFNLLAFFVLSVVGGMLGDQAELLTGIYSLGVLLPSVAVTVRRLHDIGRSGWWALLMVVPVVGALILVIFALQDSQAEENEYGPNPKAPVFPYQA
ncbi:MAG: DUF805 domain-containing protein [Zoogloea sp.]|jgi:uncharacterized membrane protein YhaH (DUF805 family)|nr:DUF805 domain-containing protein [Zoogloea sp.]MBP7393176.1 DUF805 domain-containing protein [Zoogloea sp.]